MRFLFDLRAAGASQPSGLDLFPGLRSSKHPFPASRESDVTSAAAPLNAQLLNELLKTSSELCD